MTNKVINFQLQWNEKHKEEIFEMVNNMLSEKTPLTDTAHWSREKLETAFSTSVTFIGCYDHLYDLYEYMRMDFENELLRTPSELEFYNDVLSESTKIKGT